MRAAIAHSAKELPLRRSLKALHTLKPGTGLAALVGLYVVLVPSLHLTPATEPYNEKRLLQLAILLGGAVTLFASRQLRAEWLRTFGELPAVARWALGAVLALGCVAAARAPLPRYAFLEVGHYVLLFGLTVSLAACFRRFRETASKAAVAVVALSLFLYSVVFGVGYVAHLFGGELLLWPETHTGFANTRFFNQYQTWTLPLIVAAPALLAGRAPLLRGAFYGLAAFWWMLLLASGGRGTMLAMAAAFAVTALVYRQAAWPWLKRQVATLLGGGVLFALLFKVIAATQSSLLDRNIAHQGLRVPAWKEALDMIGAAPLLGVGPMHYAYFPNHSTFAHPHNVVLQWSAEWGLPAALILFGLAAWGLWAWMRHVRTDASSMERQGEAPSARVMVRVAVTGALVAGGAHALVSGVAVMPLSQLLMALIVGWAWGLHRKKQRGPKPPTRRAPRLAQLFCVAAVIAVAWGVADDAPHLDARQDAFAEKAELKVLWPRYWQQGYIGY